MDDFMKSKTVFIITFLAALFAMYPIVQEYGHMGISIFDIKVTVKFFYLMNMGLLSLSVYFFSLEYISEKSFKFIRIVGNTLYSLAVLWPILFVLFYIATLLITYIVKLINFQIVSISISIIMGILITLVAQRIFKVIKNGVNFKEKESIIQKILVSKSINLESKDTPLERAEMVYEKGIYDPVAPYCFHAVTQSLINALEKKGINATVMSDSKVISLAIDKKILPETYIDYLKTIREVRNKSVHSLGLEIDEKTARSLLDKTYAILNIIE